VLLDAGHVRHVPRIRVGIGAGVREQYRSASLKAFVAISIGALRWPAAGRHRGQAGMSAGFVF
jgi:hypothetical protein